MSLDEEATCRSHIEADEQFARRLAAEEQQQPSQATVAAPAPANADSVTQALEILAPLRALHRRCFEDSQIGTMMDTVFEQLEGLVATSHAAALDPTPVLSSGFASSASTAESGAALPQEEAIRDAARSGSVEGLVEAVLSAASAHAALLGATRNVLSNAPASSDAASPSQEASEAGNASSPLDILHNSTAVSAPASASPASTSTPAAVEARASAAAFAASSFVESAASELPASATSASRVTEYMSRVEARRALSRRRRVQRMAALNAALDAHAAAVFAEPDQASPAGDVQFVENHSTTSVWTGPDNTPCVICCDDLVEGEDARLLPCGHVYHKECIDLWLQRSRLCCLCKRPIDGSSGGD